MRAHNKTKLSLAQQPHDWHTSYCRAPLARAARRKACVLSGEETFKATPNKRSHSQRTLRATFLYVRDALQCESPTVFAEDKVVRSVDWYDAKRAPQSFSSSEANEWTIAFRLGQDRAGPNRKQALQGARIAAVLTCGVPSVAGRCRAAAAARSPGGERSGARAWWEPFAGTLTQRSARRSKRNWFTLASVRAPRGLGVVPPEGERGRPVCDRPHGASPRALSLLLIL
ncbi:hypothetical protein HPB50_008379 [Hyalomma asiaticum]|uniref:Uncharacterized protein n=1 Tax=Hyalomma asiaticum TaxID=266040 RepID=A0ACB7TD17_HYAAI|nr:hypothetical protein HPB50_008379 [Hyalomma asiaticum]